MWAASRQASRWPTIESVADIRRNTFLARDLFRVADKTLVDRVMNLGKSHDGYAHASSCNRSSRLFRCGTRITSESKGRITFGDNMAWTEVPIPIPT